MTDVLQYLLDKGLNPRRASGEEVHLPCMFCNEDDRKRGRLYVNITMEADIPGLFMCHLCGAKGSLVSLQKFFGDATDTQEREDTGYLRRAILAEAANFYHLTLGDNEEVLRWLKTQRGLHYDTITAHQLGYANGGLFPHLRQLGYRLEDISATGLTTWDRETGRPIDFLRSHITIPYIVAGNVVMIRGRAFGDDADERKYVTPPGQKTRLFNSDATWETEELVITEGEFDCLVVEQLGYRAVACPGANIWQDGWDGYFANVRRVWVIFDRDLRETGAKGATKVLSHLGAKARVVELPPPEAPKTKNDVTEWIVGSGHDAEDFEALLRATRGLLISVNDAILEHAGLQGMDGIKFGLKKLDLLIEPGLLASQVLIFLAKTGAGKGHPLDTEIPTPAGLRRFGDLQVGEHVFGSDGRPARVVGVYDRGILPTYRVSFSDGSSVLADGDHIWRVLYRGNGDGRAWMAKDLTTRELAGLDLRYRSEWRFMIPMTAPVDYPERDLPVEPYTLGALIANGHLSGTSAVLTTPDKDVADRVAQSYPVTSIRRPPGACPAFVVRGAIGAVKKLGLNVLSREKFIPSIYLEASIEQRLALLQGLMDGDGSAAKPSASLYFSSSRRLLDDVAQLVASLGGTAKPNWQTVRGDEGRLSVMLPEGMLVFSSARKTKPSTSRYRRVPRRAIVSIEQVLDQPIRCIAVDAPDSLYLVGRQHLVTHNTIFLLNLLQWVCEKQPDTKVLLLSLEQTRGDWWERARRIWRFTHPGSTDEDAAAFWRPRLFMDDRNRLSEDQLLALLDDFHYETGEKPLLAVDYLGYWAQSFKGERYERTADAIMALKAVAKDQRLVCIAPHQVNRMTMHGTEPALDSARDSGVVEETADFVMSLWSPDTVSGKTLDQRNGEFNLKVQKSRHGGTGFVEKFYLAPLSLAIVPAINRVQSQWARNELVYQTAYHEHWQQALIRHEAGTPVTEDRFDKVQRALWAQRQTAAEWGTA